MSRVSKRRATAAARRSTSISRQAATGSDFPLRRYQHRLHLHGAPHKPPGLLTDQHFAHLSMLLKPGGHVDGVPGHKRVTRTRDDLAGVDTNPRLQAQLRHSRPHLPCRADRPQGIVLMRDRHAENSHDRIADKLLHRSTVALEDLPHPLVVAAHLRPQRLGIGPLTESGRAAQVTENDGNDLPHGARPHRLG